MSFPHFIFKASALPWAVTLLATDLDRILSTTTTTTASSLIPQLLSEPVPSYPVLRARIARHRRRRRQDGGRKEGETMRITIVFFHSQPRPIASRHSLSCFIASSGRLCRNFWFGSRSPHESITDICWQSRAVLILIIEFWLLSARNCSRTRATPTKMPRQPKRDKRTSRAARRSIFRFCPSACRTGEVSSHPGVRSRMWGGWDGGCPDWCVCSPLRSGLCGRVRKGSFGMRGFCWNSLSGLLLCTYCNLWK